jgi:hypothetical protein
LVGHLARLPMAHVGLLHFAIATHRHLRRSIYLHPHKSSFQIFVFVIKFNINEDVG